MTDGAWEALSDQAITAAGVVYFLSLLAHLWQWSGLRQLPADEQVSEGRTAMMGVLGVLLAWIACAVHLLALLARGLAADPNRVPWSNMYEFTISGLFMVTLIYLLLQRRLQLDWLAPLVIAFVLGTLTLAVIVLHVPVGPLMDALHSGWMVMHVLAAVIAVGAFTLGGFVSALYLVKERQAARADAPVLEVVAAGAGAPDGLDRSVEGSAGGAARGYWARVPDPGTLDRLAYRLHAFGFPVWTFAALITGPIWAHEAWGSYWNWDPKEVFAFITWVMYAAYLHARVTAGWKGRRAAVLALVGLATLWINFIGVNYFSTTSQHSYAAPAVAAVSRGVEG